MLSVYVAREMTYLRIRTWLACWLSAVRNMAILRGGIYRTPVSSLARQDLYCIQILASENLHNRKNVSSRVCYHFADYLFDRWTEPMNESMWRVKNKDLVSAITYCDIWESDYLSPLPSILLIFLHVGFFSFVQPTSVGEGKLNSNHLYSV